MLNPFQVVLASGSPRRRELLSRIVAEFSVETAAVDEADLTVEDPWETAEKLAWAKAQAVADVRSLRKEPGAMILGGDTVVALTDVNPPTQLAKPTSTQDAEAMLRLLSGRRHAVITGVALISPYTSAVASDTAWVTFRELSDEEIRDYVATGESMDKAGGYAIQGGAAGFVSELVGDVETVVGFPTTLVRHLLDQAK